MTDRAPEQQNSSTPVLANAKRPKRTDEKGRAFAGSQMHLQVWVNRRQSLISSKLLGALGIAEPDAYVEWLSPLEKCGFREYKDAAFLEKVGLASHAPALRTFWPSGGPVWDGLARVRRASGLRDIIVLVEAKSYPAEVIGSGCRASPASKKTIEDALDAAAAWLGVKRPPSWIGSLYQSANRIAHVYFLRERLGVEAHMVNVCIVDDPRRPTTEKEWEAATSDFRRTLHIGEVATPWLIDLQLPAAARAELVSPSAEV